MKIRGFMLMFLALCLFMGAAVDAKAHNRAGLEKVVLQQDELTENGVAFYFEAFVAERKDDAGNAGRYFLWSFDKFENNGDKAHIHVTVTDQKTNKKNNEVFHLMRNTDSSWNHVDESGKVITANIYTMVEPSMLSTVDMIVVAFILCVVLFLVMHVRKTKQKMAQKAASHQE